LELCNGLAFVERQKRMTIDDQDLLFSLETETAEDDD
jgi:predicted nuclease of restriction endonuclease-like (RecB) superfamily